MVAAMEPKEKEVRGAADFAVSLFDVAPKIKGALDAELITGGSELSGAMEKSFDGAVRLVLATGLAISLVAVELKLKGALEIELIAATGTSFFMENKSLVADELDPKERGAVIAILLTGFVDFTEELFGAPKPANPESTRGAVTGAGTLLLAIDSTTGTDLASDTLDSGPNDPNAGDEASPDLLFVKLKVEPAPKAVDFSEAFSESGGNTSFAG